jgi:hypothetical protein
MANQSDHLETARAAAQRVLQALPRAAESLDRLTAVLETANMKDSGANATMGISIQSVEQLAEGFRGVVDSLERGKMGKELAATLETVHPTIFAQHIEDAATSIQSFISSAETMGASDVDQGEMLKAGKLSRAAEKIVASLEDIPAFKNRRS